MYEHLIASEHPGLFGDKCVLVIDRQGPLRCTFNKGDGCAALNKLYFMPPLPYWRDSRLVVTGTTAAQLHHESGHGRDAHAGLSSAVVAGVFTIHSTLMRLLRQNHRHGCV